MDRRLSLDQTLRSLTDNVYFQPPENLKLRYPCILYELESMEATHANNSPYAVHYRYSLTVIDRDPESAIAGKIAQLPMCRHERHFVNDNLHHDVFTIY